MLHPSPRVSIGVPVYNGERFLAAALDSVLGQTFGNLEVVISDNASTDRTEEICRDYAARDARVRYVQAETNRGLAWNFNRVAALAEGEYFKWAAYDDVVAPTYLERCVEILDGCPDVAWCHSWTRYLGETGKPLPGFAPLAFFSSANATANDEMLDWTRGAARPHQRFFAVMAGPGEVYDIYGLIRRRELLRTGLHRPFYGADRVLMAELSLRGRYAEVPDVLFYARRHADQTVFGPRAKIERQTSGRTAQRWFLPRRLRRTWWMARLALQAELPVAERLRCLAAVGRFVAQPAKWKRLAIDGARKLGFPIAVPEDELRRAAFVVEPKALTPSVEPNAVAAADAMIPPLPAAPTLKIETP